MAMVSPKAQATHPLVRNNLLPIEIVGLHHDSAPVDVDAIAKDLGLLVLYAPLNDRISGKIERMSPSFYEVTVNGNHPRVRQRFTLAHEIAHFILHKSMIGDGIVDDAMYRSDRGDVIERQASSYAATILMPARLVREAYEAGATSPEALAKAFGVSRTVAEIRKKELRLP